MPAGCERPISATAMPTKPAPDERSRAETLCWSPMIGLSAIMPKSASLISMVTMMNAGLGNAGIAVFCGVMPERAHGEAEARARSGCSSQTRQSSAKSK